jgi:acyl-CoA synthetase (AMP-forming)/AMP-acid ligase II
MTTGIQQGGRTNADGLQTFFACAYLGAALVLLNYAYTEHEMVELLKIICKCCPYHL